MTSSTFKASGAKTDPKLNQNLISKDCNIFQKC